MRFVPVKSADRQAQAMVLSARELLVKQRTQLINAVRGHAGEFGVIAARGTANVAAILARMADTKDAVPARAQHILTRLGQQIERLDSEIEALDTEMAAQHKASAGQPALGRGTRRRPDRGADHDVVCRSRPSSKAAATSPPG